MGCGLKKANKINIESNITIPKKRSNTSMETNNTNINYNKFANKISKKNWLRIIDYLQYNELKEIGKTNRTFNYLIKDDKILIKFFKRKKTNLEYIKINQCNDISHFNNNTLVQNIIDGINYF